MVKPTFFLLVFMGIIVLFSMLNVIGLHDYVPEGDASKLHLKENFISIPEKTKSNDAKETIAYAISITSCSTTKGLLDGAAVLQHSIHLNSIRVSKNSRYDYAMFAFVHPDATNCSRPLAALGYQVQIRETPIRIEDVRGEYKNSAARVGCCGEKEWLKLYAYVLTDFPAVVHLDLDVLITQPLDDLFDAMLLGSKIQGSMWNETPKQIDAFFTRDYNMIIPGKREAHRVGVQGGFLVVRPDQNVFDEYIDIILEGNFTVKDGWGLMYGGYYGAGTIQGLASYYYGHVRPGTAVELNRCLYNNMADDPRSGSKYDNVCRTMQNECDDCRLTNISLVRSIHYTECFKPWKCSVTEAQVWNPNLRRQCLIFHHEWFRVRKSLEMFWERTENHKNTNQIISMPARLDVQNASNRQRTLSYCTLPGKGIEKYTPIEIPPRLFGATTD